MVSQALKRRLGEVGGEGEPHRREKKNRGGVGKQRREKKEAEERTEGGGGVDGGGAGGGEFRIGWRRGWRSSRGEERRTWECGGVH